MRLALLLVGQIIVPQIVRGLPVARVARAAAQNLVLCERRDGALVGVPNAAVATAPGAGGVRECEPTSR